MNKENFKLSNIKKISGGGLHVEFETTIQQDGSIIVFKDKKDSPIVPHPDLTELLDKLKRPVLKTLRFLDLETIITKGTLNEEDKKAFKKIEKFTNGTTENLLRNLEITGISVSGEKQDKLKIMAKMTDGANGKNAMNSPLLNLSGTNWEFEQWVKETTEKIIDEVYQYLFEDKKSEFQQVNIEEQD